ncbi:MAG: riboflavin synthase [Candidatus Eisenbacteria bacterium]|uniref:Riboflavin synthase n=1 Tax=Eiseniibacteriota bacterium TaxID=2212470 RepID=A0A7Y2E8T5_UNCEI|nr:riboflavin synthase [Candidatus Eisenbacteria bacterium]
MFSGIIEALGKVIAARPHEGGLKLVLEVPDSVLPLDLGASLAVNGTCLTVVKTEAQQLEFDAVGATLERTALANLKPGMHVNLERCIAIGQRLDGHYVTGHVDGLGKVTAIQESDGAKLITVSAPEALAKQITPRGSVAIDGISLTVAAVDGTTFTVSIVPYTLEHTNMGTYEVGTTVHLETDILAKYVQRYLEPLGSSS